MPIHSVQRFALNIDIDQGMWTLRLTVEFSTELLAWRSGCRRRNVYHSELNATFPSGGRGR